MATRVLSECFFGDLCHFSITDFSEPAHESSYSVLNPWVRDETIRMLKKVPLLHLLLFGSLLSQAAAPLPYSRMGGVSLPGERQTSFPNPRQYELMSIWVFPGGNEVGHSVAAHRVLSVPWGQPSSLGNALSVPYWPFLLPFSLPERRYSRSRPKTGVLNYSSHVVTSRQPSEMALTPLTEQEGEAYLEKCGSIRRHTVANAHSDIQLLAMASMMHTGMVIEESDSTDKCLLLQPSFSHRQCSSEPNIADGPEGVIAEGRQDPAELNCTSVS